MIRRCFIVFWVFTFAILSCKKQPFLYPTVSLSYASDKGNFSESYLVDYDFDQLRMNIANYTDTLPSPSSDSVNLVFYSSLSPASTHGGAIISINHIFAKSQLSYTGGRWVLNNNNDFVRIFQGSLTARKPGVIRSNTVDVNFRTSLTSPIYTLYDNADNANVSISMSSQGDLLNWAPFWDKIYGAVPTGTSSPQLVTISLSGKLVNAIQSDTITLSSFKFQGPFIEGP